MPTVIMLVAGTYCVAGGMYSVILNDVIQLVLKVFAAVIIAVIAIRVVTAEQLAQAVPAGWDDLFFGWTARPGLVAAHPGLAGAGLWPRRATGMGCSASSFRPCSSRACW